MVMVTGNEAGRMPGSDCAALEPNTKGFESVQMTKGRFYIKGNKISSVPQ